MNTAKFKVYAIFSICDIMLLIIILWRFEKLTLGERIKRSRKKMNYTLKELADITKLSVGFLSNIERDMNSPSISNLQQICQALNVNLMELLDENASDSPVTKLEERQEIFSYPDSQVKVENIIVGKNSINGIVITIEHKSDQYSDMSWGHSYDEVGVVIEGQLEIDLDREKYCLNAGDTIFIKSFTPHRYRNPIDEKSVVYWFSSRK